MFALLGSVVGFLGALAPDLFGIFKDKKDKSHELEILDRQIDLIKANHSTRMEEIYVESEGKQAERLYDFANHSGVHWVDAFSGTVRPFLTYSFFALYAWIKVSAFMLINSQNHDVILSAVQLWSAEDETIFSAIISFWFGSRAFRRKGG